MFTVRRGKQRHHFVSRQEALAFARANAAPGQPWDIRAVGEAPPPRPLRGVQEAFADASRGRMFGRNSGGWD